MKNSLIIQTFKNAEKEKFLQENLEIDPLTDEQPTETKIKGLIESWLNGKAVVLSGGKSKFLSTVARAQLVKRVKEERLKDQALRESQIIEASITSLKIVSQTPKRIEVKAKIAYRDQRSSSSGEIISETSIPSLKVTYILGREKNLWQVVDYISGS